MSSFLKGLTDPRARAILEEQAAAEQKVVAERDQLPRNVLLTACAGDEIRVLSQFARDSEAQGHQPLVEWWRDEAGQIVGIAIVTRIAAAKAIARPMGATP